MRTEHLSADDPGTIARAATLLKAGLLVVFPTDTVYGIGAAAFDEAAVAALYRAKDRPLDKGIPILLAEPEDVYQVTRELPPYAQVLLDRFWPGALTLIVPRHPNLPPNISPNGNVAVRVPDDDVARALIRGSGGALATSSANVSGAPAARNAGEALRAFRGLVAAVVDGGPAPSAVASSIVDCTVDPPQILRRGAIAAEALSLFITV